MILLKKESSGVSSFLLFDWIFDLINSNIDSTIHSLDSLFWFLYGFLNTSSLIDFTFSKYSELSVV
jgi:hypothetical protein